MTAKTRKNTHLIWRYPLTTLTVIWVVCALALAVMGPFGSFMSMSFGGRLFYWGGVVGSGTYLAHFLRLGILKVAGGRYRQFTLDLVMAPMYAVIYVPPLYVSTQYVTEGRAPFSLLQMFGMVFAVTAALIVIREVLGLHAPGLDPETQAGAGSTRPVDDGLPRRPGEAEHEAVAPADGDTPATEQTVAPIDQPPLVERLPDEARGEVLSISGSDHYVDIKTEAGSASVLLRFSDALREVEPVPGQRVHRSHWVADAAVARMRRDGKRHFVVLKTGEELPVSRTYAQNAFDRWGAAAE